MDFLRWKFNKKFIALKIKWTILVKIFYENFTVISPGFCSIHLLYSLLSQENETMTMMGRMSMFYAIQTLDHVHANVNEYQVQGERIVCWIKANTYHNSATIQSLKLTEKYKFLIWFSLSLFPGELTNPKSFVKIYDLEIN